MRSLVAYPYNQKGVRIKEKGGGGRGRLCIEMFGRGGAGQ